MVGSRWRVCDRVFWRVHFLLGVFRLIRVVHVRLVVRDVGRVVLCLPHARGRVRRIVEKANELGRALHIERRLLRHVCPDCTVLILVIEVRFIFINKTVHPLVGIHHFPIVGIIVGESRVVVLGESERGAPGHDTIVGGHEVAEELSVVWDVRHRELPGNIPGDGAVKDRTAVEGRWVWLIPESIHHGARLPRGSAIGHHVHFEILEDRSPLGRIGPPKGVVRERHHGTIQSARRKVLCLAARVRGGQCHPGPPVVRLYVARRNVFTDCRFHALDVHNVITPPEDVWLKCAHAGAGVWILQIGKIVFEGLFGAI